MEILSKDRKRFFFEKKKQKTFPFSVLRTDAASCAWVGL
jgi:hypothetical protein